jgi:hypothetical protein
MQPLASILSLASSAGLFIASTSNRLSGPSHKPKKGYKPTCRTDKEALFDPAIVPLLDPAY